MKPVSGYGVWDLESGYRQGEWERKEDRRRGGIGIIHWHLSAVGMPGPGD